MKIKEDKKHAKGAGLAGWIANRRMTLHQVDNHAEANDAVVIRRKALEIITGKDLHEIGAVRMDYNIIKNRNAENVFGSVAIPVGVVGPLRLRGKHSKGDFYVPMATTEGALIAGVNRGARAITESGGANARVVEDSMTRAPVFAFGSITDVEEFVGWIDTHKKQIARVAESTTAHGRLKDIMHFIMGNNVWLRFGFETGDAMGMNMVTIATEAACAYIEENFKGARCVAVSGNMCSDKKESMINSILGRGKSVVADAVIGKRVIKNTFHTTAAAIHDVNLRKNWLGSARAGSSTGHNAHFANTIAAIFLATGQDAAQVVESSSGYTWTEVRGNNLYISVTLPSLEVGTVGGGTGLPTQREALSIMGVHGGGEPPGLNALRFAEIISAAVLSGELNLLGILSTHELGKAHRKFGRSK